MWVMLLMFIGLTGRLAWVMVFRSGYYLKRADDVQERERKIKAARGVIYDCNGTVLAGNQSVCTVTVIHNQITDSEKVIQVLSKELSLDEAYVRARVEKKTSIERIKSNVSKDIGDIIRSYKLDGVNVDEDYARIYPYETLASKVIGFTGGDNQGIIGVEVMYDAILAGTEGRLLTKTDVRGVEVENADEHRIEPVRGYDLYLTMDYQVQMYVQQIAEKICAQKQAKSVSVILMNPQDGSIYAMVNVPEFNLNEPFTLTESLMALQDETNTQDLLNQMWRNSCINDTYEPGSSFKIVTATAALEEKVVTLNDMFSCPGYRIVEDRRIRCHKTVGHGSETFEQGFMNSCNPVFMDVGARLGAENLYVYFEKLGLFEKTGVDLPGESGSIMHQVENIGAVELATISFGQSFQITPLQLLRAVSAVINGGILVTPHVAAYAADEQGNVIEQSPNAGSLAKSGDNVKIVISRGEEQAETTSVAVPGVKGLTEDAARSAIQNVGLAVGNVSSAYSDSVASGQIISQSPVADTAVDAGTAVDFVVSMGAEPAQEVTPTTYKINLNIKKPNNESVAAANIYLYDGADGTGNILEQWTNQSISLFGEDGLSISKSGMLASSGSLKIDWLGADGQQLGSSQIVSPISFKAE